MKNCYWQPSVTVPNRQAPKHEDYDFVILGGGFGGLSVARFLKQRDPSLKVLILERDYVGFGASGRNGGFAMTLLGINGSQLVRDAKLEPARKAHALMNRSVQHVRELVRDYAIDCEAVDEGFMTVALNRLQAERVRHEAQVYRRLGTEARLLEKADLRQILPDSKCLEAAVWDPNAIMLHPFKLARALKTVAEDLGVEIAEGYGAESFTPIGSEGYSVQVTGGARLKARKLVVTLNAYAHTLGLFKAGVVPIYTYIVATEPLSAAQWDQIGWAKRQGIESAFRLVHYMRPTRDGRILLGGKSARYYFGHNTDASHDENKTLFRALREDLVKFFPALQGIQFSHGWGGPVGSTLNFFPSVGIDTKRGDLLWALGCCGHGVSISNYYGKIVSDLAFGNATEDTDQFFVNKKPWPLLPPEPLKYLAAGGYKNVMWAWDRVDEIRTGQFF